MLRIHFTFDDLCRVRVAKSPDVLWEISNGFQTLHRRDGARQFGHWRCWAEQKGTPGVTRLLRPLLPQSGYSPDFLTPLHGDHTSPDTAIDTVLSTPVTRLRADIERTVADRRLPSWSRDLAAGDTDTLRELGGAMRVFYENVLRPVWPHLQARIDHDRRARLRTLRDEGVAGLLSGLTPFARWDPPVLEIDYPVERELKLEGRGLILQPSFFCWPRPVTLADSERRPVLVHPVRHETCAGRDADAYGTGHHDALAAVLGNSTRAAVLRCACGACCLSVDLARRLGITSSAVTQQTKLLREASLITSSKYGRTVYHVATALGLQLVRGAGPPSAKSVARAVSTGSSRP